MVKTKKIGTLCNKKQTGTLGFAESFWGFFWPYPFLWRHAAAATAMDTKTIRYGIWDDSFQPFLKEIITAFEQENPGVQVDLQVVPWADYWPKLQTSLSAGTAWDVFWINAPYFPVYESYGVISDLSDEYRKAGVDLDKFPKALVEMYQVDGRPYTLPWFFDTLVFYYNKARFDEAGLKYPNADWTLDDVQAAAEQLRNKEAKQWGIYLNTYFAEHLGHFALKRRADFHRGSHGPCLYPAEVSRSMAKILPACLSRIFPRLLRSLRLGVEPRRCTVCWPAA